RSAALNYGRTSGSVSRLESRFSDRDRKGQGCRWAGAKRRKTHTIPALSLFTMLCYVMLCYVMLCYVMLCYVMLCYVMLCYVMLCYHYYPQREL
ncbi:hypothetical protein THAOC_22742, partial [Thalassiosira oceanica]